MIAADSEQIHSARTLLEHDFLARSSAAAKISKRRSIEELAYMFVTPGTTLYPLDEETVLNTAAALKAAGFRAAWSYLDELRAGHVEAHFDVPLWLARILTNCRRSVLRGLGPPDRAAELPLASLPEQAASQRMPADDEPADAWTSCVVAFRWLLREIEITALKRKDVSLDHSNATASLNIEVSKNDTSGIGAKRVWKCTCRSGDLERLACPYHVLEKYVDGAASTDPEQFLFGTARGTAPSKEGVINAWRCLCPQAAEVSGHSPRRSGALHLARQGWSCDDIKLLGRWRSDAVRAYVAEALALKEFELSLEARDNEN
eukprot:6460311-Amphidinium_carterae.1